MQTGPLLYKLKPKIKGAVFYETPCTMIMT